MTAANLDELEWYDPAPSWLPRPASVKSVTGVTVLSCVQVHAVPGRPADATRPSRLPRPLRPGQSVLGVGHVVYSYTRACST